MKELFILHLSDLHFGTNRDADKWYSQLADDLKNELNCKRLDILLISGDISNKSDSNEYAAAYTFISKLSNEFDLEPSRIIIVPGNHDINWSLSKKCYRLEHLEDVADVLFDGNHIKISDEVVEIRDEDKYHERFKNFFDFYEKVKGEAYPINNGEPGIIHFMREEGLLILGLNSAWETDHFYHERISICPDAIDAALDEIRKKEYYRDSIKFAVWHHPLFSPYKDRIADHGFMERLAQNNFMVCLHGHLHKAEKNCYKNEYTANGKIIHIVGAGTFGAPINEWTPGHPLQYNLIKIAGNSLIVETRRRLAPNGAWIPDAIWTQGASQDPLPRYSIELPQAPNEKTLTESVKKKYDDAIKELENQKKLSLEISKYCQKTIALHESIPLSGFKTSLRVPVRINDIYVPLRAIVDERLTGKACFADAEDAEKHLSKCHGGREMSIPEAFLEANQKNRRGIVILGDPGSGKTTQLKRVLLWCLQNGLGELNLPENTIPIFLPLRDLKDINNSLDEFIQEQLNHPHLEIPHGFGKRLLDRANLLFLLDGLDEVAETTQRVKVSRWIEDAMRIHKTCRFVVTCRFAGYTDDARLNADFLEMHLRPLSNEQVKEFVHNWYRIVEKEFLNDATQAELIAKEKAENLLQKLQEPEFRSARLFAMTRNPLLLTNICLVHLDRGNLPHTRAALYDECTDVLLERWRGATGFKTTVSAHEGRQVLQPVAFWLHQEKGRTRAKAEELSPIIEPVLKTIGWTKGKGNDFLKAVCNESGILTGWDQQHYGFMHLAFQEYLAAREIRTRYFNDTSDTSILRDLAERFGDSWWQEVGLLLLALDDPSLFVPYMRELVKLPAFAANPQLVEMSLDDAAVTSPIPFIDLIKTDAKDGQDLWNRQLLALRIVERLDKEAIKDILPLLKQHPDERIRAWGKSHSTVVLQEIIYSEKSGIELVRIPGGEFKMGLSFDYDDEIPHSSYEEPKHIVEIPTFYIGRYPVTNEEYARFLRDNPKLMEPYYWGDTRLNQPRQPVVGVSWKDAKLYAKWAGLRLPTESEWEYACRANSQHKLSYKSDKINDLLKIGWCRENSRNNLSPVGLKEQNDFGLYDMLGNVWEWVEDDWHDGYEGAPCDGKVWINKHQTSNNNAKVVRGGSFYDYADDCRITCRDCWTQDSYNYNRGFRLAKSL